MNTRSVQLSPGPRRQPKPKHPPQSLFLVLLPMILSILGGAVGYFFMRGYFSRATELGVFFGYLLGWAIEASIRVPTETAAQRKADALQAAAEEERSKEAAGSTSVLEEPSPAFDARNGRQLPAHFAAR